MATKKIRVLLDLSLALLGYSGIPQDARLMYKIMSILPDVKVTGLIYEPGHANILHDFDKDDVYADRLVNQALFLEALTERRIPWSAWRVVKLYQKIKYNYRLLFSNSIQTNKLETEFYWDVVWRNIFSKTLSDNDIDLAKNGEFLIANLGNGVLAARGSLRLPLPKINTSEYDFFISQDSRPIRVSKGTYKIVRYHDLIPVMRPDQVANSLSFIRWHHVGIKRSLKDTFYVCNSEPTREDLIKAYPQLESKSLTIPYALSSNYYPEHNANLLPYIFNSRLSQAAYQQKPINKKAIFYPYILSVATLEPRKNFIGLVRAFEQLKAKYSMPLQLVIVGSPGWKYEPTLAAMRPLIKQGHLIHLESVPAEELRVLYSHALAFAFPSYYEGFGFPPMEAMQCGTPVVVSDISAHRWVMKDAAMYCDPYSVNSIAEALEQISFSKNSEIIRKDLIEKGKKLVKEYSLERAAENWLNLFIKIKETGGV